MKNMNAREHACVLAALAFWAREGAASGGHERDIASGEGQFDELNADEIEALRQRLSAEGETVTYAGLADKVDEIIQCFSTNGEFNSHSAPMGTVELREQAVEVRDALQQLGDGEAICSVMMQDFVGDYDRPEELVEWKWVQENASFAHRDNGRDGIWEFMLNLSRTFDAVPMQLQQPIRYARQAGFAYLLFHQGT
ncbi:hypothetical protein [Ottowia sp.]|uniref:hypothetical protein n=1 Tax=Ottowia sp. TaxID=1898956 RepID=UPI0025F2386F|nr:hypothetical protein [Ottowia sp.]MBK6616544.1 hypothetical protein [Ottowia sp.]